VTIPRGNSATAPARHRGRNDVAALPLKVLIRRLALAGLALVALAGPARAGGNLFFYNWRDYFPPELLARFTDATGIKVTTGFYDTNEMLLANLRAGAADYDVIVPSDYMVKILIDEGLLMPIDAPGMANFKYVKRPFDHPWFDPDRRYSAPNMWGTSGFMYDSRQVEGGTLEESWKEFFDPRPELVGKVVALDDQLELYRAAAYYVGVDPCAENADEAQKILDVLLAQKPKLAFYTSGANPNQTDTVQAGIDAIATKQVGLAQAWDGGARFMKRSVPTIVYVIPKEGSSFWQDSYAVPYGAPHTENARIFINWVMDPKNIAQVSNFAGYTNSIAGSEKYVDPAMARDQSATLPPEYTKRLRNVSSCTQAARDISDRVWARLWPRTVK
jgi:spermidine/putrescine transport system substrate-binding protein